MALAHPATPPLAPANLGRYRERDILRQLEDGLPQGYDIFHNLLWSTLHQGEQGFGEYDIVVLAPGGALLIVEVKAGAVTTSPDERLLKRYGAHGSTDVGLQMRRMHASLQARMHQGALPQVPVGALLVLPDMRVQGEIVACPRERIVDAGQMDHLCSLVQQACPQAALDAAQRQRVLDFLLNKFALTPDVGTLIGQVQSASTQLASGLATWVPRIRHADQIYQIEATAGSGKTQLALALLREAAAQAQSARYVCFNRPLADHLARLAPPACEVTTFHQLCREHAERQGQPPDFADPNIFAQLVTRYLQDAPAQAARLDLLILDEAQDLEPAWVQALGQALRPQGRLYLMGDSQQRLYAREAFALPGAVQMDCMDNFRSPQRVVQMINRLRLTPQPVQARSAHVGETPHFHVWEAGHTSALGQLNACLHQLWQDGYTPEQVAVLSYRGLAVSDIFQKDRLGGCSLRRFTGRYDSAGNPEWTGGTLRLETLYRFKGQSAPAVVLCDVDFEHLGELEQRKLFVGLTRAQLRVDVVLSERAAQGLVARLGD